MFFTKEHRKTRNKQSSPAFTSFLLSPPANYAKRKSILAQKEQTYWSRPHTLLTRQTKKGKKDSKHSFCQSGYSCRSHS